MRTDVSGPPTPGFLIGLGIVALLANVFALAVNITVGTWWLAPVSVFGIAMSVWTIRNMVKVRQQRARI